MPYENDRDEFRWNISIPKKMKHVYLKNDFTHENTQREWKSLSTNLLKPWHQNQNRLQKDLGKDHLNSVQLKKPKKFCLKVREKEMPWWQAWQKNSSWHSTSIGEQGTPEAIQAIQEKIYKIKQYLLWTLKEALDIANGCWATEVQSKEDSFVNWFGRKISFRQFYEFIKANKQ